ncbi:MAG: hypothetical protein JRF17_04710 [Deltaproteobacteria bacterium]|jgi:hypothetical protein|nr:hypothetical protein [Deltaproteobacteria bacterium]
MNFSNFYLVTLGLAFLFFNSSPAYSDFSPLKSREDESVAIKRERFSIPILFEENVGQFEERNQFKASTSLFTAGFSAGEIRFVPRGRETFQRAQYRTLDQKQ